MAYLRPPWFQRKIFNPLAMRFGIGGAVTLAVPGRKTGNLLEVPVTPVEIDGTRYIVGPRGEAEWVKNLRANGNRAELRHKGKAEPFTGHEIPVEARPPIIEAYRDKTGRATSGYFKQLPDAADHPTFRVEI